MPKLNDEAYAHGKKLWVKGATLRSVFEPIIDPKDDTVDNGPGIKSRQNREGKEGRDMSTVLGFLDGFLDAVRKR